MLQTVPKTIPKTDVRPTHKFDRVDTFEVLFSAGTALGMSAEWAIDLTRSNEGQSA